MNRAEKIAAIKDLLTGRGHIDTLFRGHVDLTAATHEEQATLKDIQHRNRDLFSKGARLRISELPDAEARFIYSIHTRNK